MAEDHQTQSTLPNHTSLDRCKAIEKKFKQRRGELQNSYLLCQSENSESEKCLYDTDASDNYTPFMDCLISYWI